MRALHVSSVSVPWGRIAREHRAALMPLAVVLAINVVVLVALVLPRSRAVSANEQRAVTAERAEAAAQAEYRQAMAVRDGKTRAVADLETFYKQVLPPDVPAARRILIARIYKLADEHRVAYQRGTSDTRERQESSLEEFTFSLTVTGNYDDLRAFLYELETSPDFIVIDHILLAEGQDATAPLSLSMDISTYYRVPVTRAQVNGR
jgi:type IV pilus assembly protein PilO